MSAALFAVALFAADATVLDPSSADHTHTQEPEAPTTPTTEPPPAEIAPAGPEAPGAPPHAPLLPTPSPATLPDSTSPGAHAPERSAPTKRSNLVFAEAFGNGLLYSLDYERLLDTWNLGVRVGASFFTYSVSKYGDSGNLTLASFPIVVSHYVGPKNHKLQLGLGTTILYLDASTDSQGNSFGGDRAGLGIAATCVVGYRYVPRDGGLSFGVGFTPLVRTSSFLAWGGMNVGWLF